MARTRVVVGGVPSRIDGPPKAIEAVQEFVGGFASNLHAGARIHLRVSADEDAFRPLDRLETGMVTWDPTGTAAFSIGPATGSFDPSTGAGFVEGARDVGDIEVLLRLALSTTLPAEDGVLLHGATIPIDGGAIVVIGHKGAGKSTAARLFRGVCDELSVVRLADDHVIASSTPYWNGRPFDAPCERIVCLERGGVPDVTTLSSTDSVRELGRHVIRYVSIPEVNAAALRVLAVIARDVEVVHATCPEGDEYPGFIGSALGMVPA